MLTKQDDASQKNILKKLINFFAEQRTILFCSFGLSMLKA